jgi:hypothetical protein
MGRHGTQGHGAFHHPVPQGRVPAGTWTNGWSCLRNVAPHPSETASRGSRKLTALGIFRRARLPPGHRRGQAPTTMRLPFFPPCFPTPRNTCLKPTKPLCKCSASGGTT